MQMPLPAGSRIKNTKKIVLGFFFLFRFQFFLDILSWYHFVLICVFVATTIIIQNHLGSGTAHYQGKSWGRLGSRIWSRHTAVPCLIQISTYTAQTHLPRDGCTHSGLGFSTSISNPENDLQTGPQANLVGMIPQLRVPRTKYVQAWVKLSGKWHCYRTIHSHQLSTALPAILSVLT